MDVDLKYYLDKLSLEQLISEITNAFATKVHIHTKSQVGLENVDNTSDMDKPISTAQQSALDKKIILSATEPIGQKIGDVWLIADE